MARGYLCSLALAAALVAVGEEAGRKIFIYPVESGKAAELADTLKQALGRPSASPTDAPGTTHNPHQGSPAAPGAREQPRIMPDPATNSLIIYGTAQEFQNIKNILKEFDIPNEVSEPSSSDRAEPSM